VLLASSACRAGDEKVSTAISSHAVAVTMPEAILDKIVLVSPAGATWALDVPKSQTSTDTKPITLNQYDSSWVDVPVEDVSKVASVEANQQKLNFRPGKPAKPGDKPKSISVEVTRDLTVKAGSIDLSVLDKDGKVLTQSKFRFPVSIARIMELNKWHRKIALPRACVTGSRNCLNSMIGPACRQASFRRRAELLLPGLASVLLARARTISPIRTPRATG